MLIKEIGVLIHLQQLHHISKFYKNIDEYYSSGAAYIANLTLDSILDYYKKNGERENYDKWSNWRSLTEFREEYKIICRRIKNYPLAPEEWSEMQIISKQREILSSFYSPFIVNEKIEDQLLNLFPTRILRQ